jgi:hypothetical protein
MTAVRIDERRDMDALSSVMGSGGVYEKGNP